MTWDVPLDQLDGPVIVCLSVIDLQVHSPPFCVSYIVTSHITITVDLNGPTIEDNVYRQSYVHNIDDMVPLTSLNTQIPAGTFSHMIVYFISHYDTMNETLDIHQYNHPSISITYLSPQGVNSPQVLLVTGPANSDVYLNALKHTFYKNTQYEPTAGERIIAIKLCNRATCNTLTDTHINMTVSVPQYRATAECKWQLSVVL